MFRRAFIGIAKWGLVSLALVIFPIFARTQEPEFRWIDEQNNRVAWAKLRTAFRKELKPDAADATGSDTYRFKYLHRVGVLGDSALVIIGHRIEEHLKRNELGSEDFLAFNYDFATGTISKILNPEDGNPLAMFQWKLVNMAHLEPSAAPDVIFTYLTCWECEPEKMLSSFLYDSPTRKWQVRRWGNGKPYWWMTPMGLVLAEDVQDTDTTLSFDCQFGLKDFDGDGFDDVAIRCREVTEPARSKREVKDVTILYSLENGHFASAIVTDKQQRGKILSELCHAHPSTLCKGVANSN